MDKYMFIVHKVGLYVHDDVVQWDAVFAVVKDLVNDTTFEMVIDYDWWTFCKMHDGMTFPCEVYDLMTAF